MATTIQGAIDSVFAPQKATTTSPVVGAGNIGGSAGGNFSNQQTGVNYDPSGFNYSNFKGGNTPMINTGTQAPVGMNAASVYQNGLNSPTLASTPVNNTPTAHTVSGATALTVPPPKVDTTSSALAGYTTGTMNQYGTQQTIKDATAATRNTIDYANQTNTGNTPPNNQDLTSRIAEQYGIDPSKIMSQLATKGQVTSDLNTQYQVPQKIQQAQDAYNNYNSASLALNQQIEQIRTTPGISTEQAQQQINEVSKEGNANLANLAVINQAAQGNMSTAMNIVQMKLDQQFKPIQDQIDALAKFTTVNNADLTNSQQVQLENQRFVMQNNLNNLMSAKQSAHQFALQQGIQDPNVLKAIDNAQTPADVYAAVGGNARGLPNSPSNQGATPQAGTQDAINTYVDQGNQGYIDHSSDGIPYVDQGRLQNMTSYQKQQASNQFNAAGIRVLDTQDVQALGTIDEAKQGLNQFEAVSRQLLSSGFWGRVKGFTTNQLSQLIQTDPQWRAFSTLRTGLIKAVQGAAAGAPGLRVTGAELTNAAESLPNSYDNAESAQTAVDKFRTQLDINKNVLLRGSASQGSSTGSGTGGLYDF